MINVEAQNDFYPGYPLVKRGIYDCSRMISPQYGRENSVTIIIPPRRRVNFS